MEVFMKNVRKIDWLQVVSKIVAALGLTILVCICGMSASCKVSPEGIEILEPEYTPPKLLNIQISNSSELFIEFDKTISLKELEIIPVSNPEEKIPVNVEILEPNTSFYIDCKTKFSAQDEYEIHGVVEDETQNSLTFSSILQGFNDNIPKIALSELRSFYQKPKLEYIELVALSEGNLAGMTLEIFYKTEPIIFVFPDINVKKGDFILVHGRKIDETCVNETIDLCAATYKDSVPNVVDFWLDSETKVIGNSGVILLKNRKNGDIVDALLYNEPGKEAWANETVQQAAEEAFNKGGWEGSGNIEDAAINTKPSGTRSLSRDFSTFEDLEKPVPSKNQWIFVANGNATMGSENSLVPYEE